MWVNVSVDTSKHVQPLAKVPVAAKPSAKADTLAEVGSKYKTMTKYTYFESGEKYVKVLLDFPDAKKLLKDD